MIDIVNRMEYSKCVMKNRLILVISSGCHRNNAIQIIWIASSKSILNYSVIFVKSFYDIFHCEIYSSKYSTISIFDKIIFLIYRKERNLLPLSGTKVVGEIVGETRQIFLNGCIYKIEHFFDACLVLWNTIW